MAAIIRLSVVAVLLMSIAVLAAGDPTGDSAGDPTGDTAGGPAVDPADPPVGGPAEYPGALSAALDPRRAKIGDVVRLTLRYRLPEGATIAKKPVVGGIEELFVLEQTALPGEIEIKFFVEQRDEWRSGPLTLSFEDKDGIARTLTADSVSLAVTSVLGEKPAEAQLHPLRDIILTKRFWPTYWPWAAGGAGLLLVLSGAYWWYRRRRRRIVGFDSGDPPHVSARRAIEELDKRRIFEKGDVKGFYFLFSEIMRRYLECIRDFPAAEYTTEEIAQQLKAEEDRRLLPLLRQADLVKFADTVPTPARKEENVRLALSYIRETGPASDDAQGEVNGDTRGDTRGDSRGERQ